MGARYEAWSQDTGWLSAVVSQSVVAYESGTDYAVDFYTGLGFTLTDAIMGVTVVPEPSMTLMVGVGLVMAGVAWGRRRSGGRRRE